MWRQLFLFGLREHFGEIAILFRDFRRSGSSLGIEGGEVLGERSDRVKVQDIDLIIGIDASR